MDRSSVTPSKRFETSRLGSVQQQSIRQALEQHTVLKDLEGLKLHNKHLLDEIQRLKIERDCIQARLLEELTFKEETLVRFQTEKNLQMDQFQLHAEEQMLRTKRECAAEIEVIQRQMKNQEVQLRQAVESNKLTQNKNADLNRQLNELEKELIKARELQLELAQKHAQTNNAYAKNQDEMEQEIRILLQIESDKSAAIDALQVKLDRSQASEKHLSDKLQALSAAFQQLDAHIKGFTEKLAIKERENADLKNITDRLDLELKNRDKEISLVTETTVGLRKQLEDSQRREKIRENEIRQLIGENQRLYAEVNIQRHRLHDLAVTYNFPI